MALYQIVHRTEYQFSDWVDGCVAEVRLRPRTTQAGVCENHHVVAIPLTTRRTSWTDGFGNHVDELHISRRLRRLVISGSAVVTVPGSAARETGFLPGDLPGTDGLLPDSQTRDACRGYAADLLSDGLAEPASIRALARRIHGDMIYDAALRAVGRPLCDILANRRGMCQDYVRLAVACLRAHGIPARCVVGYVLPGHRGFSARHASTRLLHAWFSAFTPGHGWLDFDPTEPGLQAHDLLALAWGATEVEVTPVQGRLGNTSAHQSLQVEITIDRLGEPSLKDASPQPTERAKIAIEAEVDHVANGHTNI